ncbi:sialidase family protein [Rubritalea tangerina]|uniref:exo-alpha-sialidase n=1 Tax=Rubritalea tangerina TaxID=430798 RepID=A0ABW4ZDX1_9BACT
MRLKKNILLSTLSLALLSPLALTQAAEQTTKSDETKLTYPTYKENETLVFRSGSFVRDGKKVTFFRDKYGVCQYRIPDMSVLPDGRLLATIVCRCNKDGDHSISTTFFAVSNDEGKTWEKITFSTDYKNIAGRPETDFPMTERTQESQVIWHPGMKQFVGVYLSKSKCWFVTSKDLKSWSKPVEAKIDMPEVKNYWPSPTSLQIDQDGSLLFAITGSLKEGGERMARLVWTKDLKNFEVSSLMPVKGNETAVIPVSNGKYFVTTRISPKRLNMTYNRKTNSWSDTTPFPQPHTWRCEVDLISDGKSLYLATPTQSRTQGRLYRSDDEGKTWQEIAKLNGEGHFGYSALVVLKNGDIGILAERGRQKQGNRMLLNDIVFQRVSSKGEDKK